MPSSLLTQSVVDRGFKRLLEVAGLPKLRFHEGRHRPEPHGPECEFASVTMKRMGHRHIRLTLQIYTHVLKQHDVDAGAG